MDDQLMRTLTARLAKAYLQANAVDTTALPALLESIFTALSSCGTSEPAMAEHVPAVPIKKSVQGAAIICLECGRTFSMLKRHLRTDHAMTPAEYREKWALPSTYPMTAPDYATRRSELALKSGLGKKKEAAPAATDAQKSREARRKKLTLWPEESH
jgi:predicted transcriptional regulator